MNQKEYNETVLKHADIVEHLKKRIEELGTDENNWSLNDKKLRDELKKIIEGDKT